jgi:hypothetical protein
LCLDSWLRRPWGCTVYVPFAGAIALPIGEQKRGHVVAALLRFVDTSTRVSARKIAEFAWWGQCRPADYKVHVESGFRPPRSQGHTPACRGPEASKKRRVLLCWFPPAYAAARSLLLSR